MRIYLQVLIENLTLINTADIFINGFLALLDESEGKRKPCIARLWSMFRIDILYIIIGTEPK